MTEAREFDSVREWLYLEPDGDLTADQRRQIDALAEGDAEVAKERRDLQAMTRLLDESRIEVREGFRSELLESLPPAGWSARHPRTWWVAAAALVLLGGGSALLTGLAAARVEPTSPFVGAMSALLDMLASSMAAGAGLLGASWRGIGLALGEWIGASAPNAVAFGALVVGVNWLVWRGLRRRERLPEAAVASAAVADDLDADLDGVE